MSLDRDLVVRALPAYQIEGEIGRGGWGMVLSATHVGLGRRVAIKQLPRAFGADPAVRQRFKEEARLVASLNHPHIVPVYDFVEHDGLCLIVMELLTGGTLWDRFLETGVPLDEACALMLAACAALQHAHDHGILHRDIKPENFLFTDEGVIKLGDFGIAKVIGQSSAALTVAGSIMGTPAYMAPEQALGQKLGPGTDVYSIGVMLYELSTGDLPFPETEDPLTQLIAKTDQEPRPITELRPDLHPALVEVTMRAIARHPEDRYATARDLGMALAEAATKAFGPGWLRRCGVQVMSAPQLIALTEQSFGVAAPAARPHRLTRATSVHPRVGDVLGPRSADPSVAAAMVDATAVAPAPPAPPEASPAAPPSPEPAAPFDPATAGVPAHHDTSATIAPDWAGTAAAGAAAAAAAAGGPPPLVPDATAPVVPSPVGYADPPMAVAPPAEVQAPTGPPDPTASPVAEPGRGPTAAPVAPKPAPWLTAPAPMAEPTSPGTFPAEPATPDPTAATPATTAGGPGAATAGDPPTGVVPVAAPGPMATADALPGAPPSGPAAPPTAGSGVGPTTMTPPAPAPAPIAPTPGSSPTPTTEGRAAASGSVYASPGAYAPTPLNTPVVNRPVGAGYDAGPGYGGPPPGYATGPGPGVSATPPRSGGGTRIGLIVVAVIAVLAVAAGAAYALTRSGGSTSTPPTTPPTTTASTDTTEAPTTAALPPSAPVISGVTQASANTVTITWQDDDDPQAAHVLVAYSANPKEQYPITRSPQDVQYTAGAPYCFEIAAIGTTIRRSEPSCINGGDPAVLVKHNDDTTTTAKG